MRNLDEQNDQMLRRLKILRKIYGPIRDHNTDHVRIVHRNQIPTTAMGRLCKKITVKSADPLGMGESTRWQLVTRTSKMERQHLKGYTATSNNRFGRSGNGQKRWRQIVPAVIIQPEM